MATMSLRSIALGCCICLATLTGEVLARDKDHARNTAECNQQVSSQKDLTHRSLEAAYLECRSIDRERQSSRYALTSGRLDAALVHLKNKEAIPAQLVKEIFADQIAIRAYPANEFNRGYRSEIQDKFARFSQQWKKESNPNWAAVAEQCAKIQNELRTLQEEHRAALAQHLSLTGKLSGKDAVQGQPSSQEFATQSRNRRDALQQNEQQKKQQHMQQLSTLNCLDQDPVVASVSESRADARTETLHAKSDAQPPLKGDLQTLGYYLSRPKGSTVSVLKEGQILIYGAGLENDHWEAQAFQSKQLSSHAQAASNSSQALPTQVWDPQRRGWHHLPGAPECPLGERSLHTSTELTSGQMLIAGGVCLRASGSGLGADVGAHTLVSILDVKYKKWRKGYALQHPRAYHSALRLSDGKVLMIGGQSVTPSDFGVTNKVLNSVELLDETASQAFPPLMQARAKHSSSQASDGSIYVTGGFDDQGSALDAAEVLHLPTRTWRALPSMRVARYAHTSTVLADGRLMVIGGWGSNGQALASVEIFNPATGAWLAGPEFPLPVHGHSAALLSDGQLLVAGGAWLGNTDTDQPWAWVWDGKSVQWTTAARSALNNRDNVSTAFTLMPDGAGGVLIFAQKNILRWTPTAAKPNTKPDTKPDTKPRWRLRPSVSPMADGRSLWIGMEFGNPGTRPPVSFIFDPKTQAWTNAGRLNRLSWARESNLLLPSKEVMHVGMQAEAMQCELWNPQTQVWSDCGFARTQYPSSQPPELGVLPDGRVVAITNLHESFVYDAENKEWTAWQSKWNPEVIQYGIVIRSDKPLLQVYDEEQQQWIALNGVGTQFWMRGTGNDGVRMLWDEASRSWPYIFGSNKVIGRNAQFLANGCVLSTQPLTIFNPSSGKAALIDDSTLADIPPFGTLHVFKNGQFVVVDQEVREENKGGAYFFGQASCDGIGRIAPERSAYPASLIQDVIGEAAVAASSGNDTDKLAGQDQDPIAKQAAQQRLQVWGKQYGMLALALLIVGLLWMISRRRKLSTVSIKTSKSFRVFIYTLLGLYAFFVLSRSLEAPPRDPWFSCESEPSACINQRTGLLTNTGAGPSEIPCEIVGIWNYRRDTVQRRIEFKDDGRYTMESMPGSYDSGKLYTGHWARQGEVMAWRHEQGSTEMEFNRIHFFKPEHFSLAEGDGTMSHFELVRLTDSQQCQP